MSLAYLGHEERVEQSERPSKQLLPLWLIEQFRLTKGAAEDVIALQR